MVFQGACAAGGLPTEPHLRFAIWTGSHAAPNWFEFAPSAHHLAGQLEDTSPRDFATAVQDCPHGSVAVPGPSATSLGGVPLNELRHRIYTHYAIEVLLSSQQKAA